ncbi:glycosyltransferase family 4 protein [Paenibacillus psychroresistens]|uniref:Glycosyltransferase family 4 protein n=1 Tax=Paenibacillus psychroresistens TaxID=1778678 RepID=A0A6B8REL0_9BACL|nr:glycosyltransferase [Paenibacillus psychroresistens]QGQ94367.1 glycosyltransferase family 4 protein [Paenibacillus psychroresistens]
MKILFLSWAYPKSNTPYLGIWAHQQALALKDKGVEVDVVNIVPYAPKFAGFISEKIKKYAHIEKQERYEGILVQHPRFFRAKPNSYLDKILSRFFWFQSKRIAVDLESEVDISTFSLIHAHNLFPDGAIAYLLHKKFNIPYVITLHDVDQYNSCPEKGFQRKLSLRILEKAKKVLVVSKRVKNNIETHVNNNQLQLFYNTYWTYARKKERTNNHSNKIITIASLIERKGVHIILQAFKRIWDTHPDYELIIIGNGSQLLPLMKLAKELNIDKHVTFTGVLEHQEAMAWLTQATIFCLPSWDEAFGVVYAEAMSYGIPIIGCKGEGIEDLVTNQVNGMLVEAESVDELEKALKFLIEHSDKAKQIGQSGRESIKELGPDLFGDRLKQLYQEIIQNID